LDRPLPYLLLGIALAAPLVVLAWQFARRERAKRYPERDDEPGRAGPLLAAIGFSLVLGSLGGGMLLLDVKDTELPEQRGIGVVPSAPPDPGRGFAVSAGLRIRSCDNPVRVTLVVTGSAEYWIDHASDMRDGGDLRVAVPDKHLSNVKVGLGVDGKLSAIAPFTEEPHPDPQIKPLPDHLKKLQTVTELAAHVDNWGRHLRPVVFEFDANWLSRRDLLGSCYLKIPALAGAPTVLSAQELQGQAKPIDKELDCPCTILEVSSAETKQHAYYQPPYETTRGVVSTVIGRNRVRTDLSQPPPDGNVRGITSWTCATEPTQRFKILENVRPGEHPELVEGGSGEATGAMSVRRLGSSIAERTCASFAVIEESSAQQKRDFTLFLLGVAFSTGLAFIVEYVRSRRRGLR
jgi:hypothetical protein